jgi:hypothetical protein
VRRVLAAALASAILWCGAAAAMNGTSVPPKFPIPWGNSASTPYINAIPQASQIGISNCRASLTDGFPPLTFTPSSAGGCAPFGADFNGILNQITKWQQWQGAGAVVLYDAGFSASIGGYPNGAMLARANKPLCVWISQVDNNTSDPDASGANWSLSCPGGGLGTATSTGSANAQTFLMTPVVTTLFTQLCFVPGFTNTGSLQISPNGNGFVTVQQLTPSGLANLVGGEVVQNTIACVRFDGSVYELQNPGTSASLNRQDQNLQGGANVTSHSIGTLASTTYAVDCGQSPLQYLTNNGAITLAAPASDGSCLVMVTNAGSAGAISFSGFTTNSNTGEPLTTTNGNRFAITIWRIAGISSFIIKALQ